ncbi:MFS transporter, MHS family, alpha-ketoglutarate permease [Bosea lupini]|uniref:MFS transporter, MHS family, alpha-ketoglutarate permease n=1 Tax=Bosea lupini TaxID=1036779 RepID=A0A1H7SI33_9HYPH|nr:MFS transporter [Bosea lupini]SEL71364.1 MFS transporter, MHS family, alpha-ketoglutarate permease [Bosea lupini]
MSDIAATGELRPAVSRRMKDLVAVNFGNTLEWFDWAIYTIFAPYFALQFFPSADKSAALLAALAVFAAGFLTRPLGGFLFGLYADRVGRKKSLTLAMFITAGGSLVIACAPTFATVGLAASVILLVARLAQGIAHGGEMGTSVTYLVERAPRHRRALYGSTSWMSVVLGTMIATVTGLLLNANLDRPALESWGWRIPFALGGLLGLYGLYLRRKLTETDSFEQVKAQRSDTASGLTPLVRNWRGVAVVFGLSAGGSIMFYTWLIYSPTFAQINRGLDAKSALTASLIAQAVFLLAIPIVGWLADRFGRRIFIILFGVGFIAATFQLDALITNSFSGLLTAMICALLILACLFGVNTAVWAEVFPTEVRATGVSGPLSLATAIFGGTAPYVNTYLSQAGEQRLFLVYLMVVSGITLITGLLIPETRTLDLDRPDTGRLSN